MFFGLQTDRGNLAQAVADNLLADIGLTTDGMFNSSTRDRAVRKHAAVSNGDSEQ